MKTLCMLSGVTVQPGELCPVHHTAECLVKGWLQEVPHQRLRDRVWRWLQP